MLVLHSVWIHDLTNYICIAFYYTPQFCDKISNCKFVTWYGSLLSYASLLLSSQSYCFKGQLICRNNHWKQILQFDVITNKYIFSKWGNYEVKEKKRNKGKEIIRKRILPSILSPANPQFTINKKTDNNNNSKHIKTRIRLPRLTIIPTILPLNKQIPTYANTCITLNLIPQLFTHTPNPELKFTKINIQLKFPASHNNQDSR